MHKGEMRAKEFVKKLNKGEKITEDELIYAIKNFNVVDVQTGSQNEHSRWVKVVIEIMGKYYMIGFSEAINECADDDFSNAYVHEVSPHKRTVMINEWWTEKHFNISGK